jgi:hypothetical protein
MLEEIRADARAGFVNKDAPWRKRQPEPVDEPVSDEFTELSSEAEARIVAALESNLLGVAAAIADEDSGLTLGGLRAVDHVMSESRMDIEKEIRLAVERQLRLPPGPPLSRQRSA